MNDFPIQKISYSYKMYSHDNAIIKMNELGSSNTPFIFIISYNTQQSIIEKICDVNINNLLYSFNGLTNENPQHKNKRSLFKINPRPMHFADYEKAFTIVRENILLGNSYLTNLTCSTPIYSDLTLKQIYYTAQAKYKLWLDENFTMFSPETFVRINGSKIVSFPMKGTISASIPNAESILLNDQKEIAEHATITDLIRNDLSSVASNVHVKRYRYVEKLHTNKGDILQTSTEIEGTLPENWKNETGTIIFRMLPAGSITGAPKAKTCKIINEAENYERRFYSGVAGIFDGEKLDSCVMIRFIEQSGKQLFYKSGGGITAKSNALSEYNEMISKIYIPTVL